MRDLRLRLQEAWRQPGLQSYVVERDYLLSWILAGISAVPELRETLVFKGGTALKKCYFGDYRFSEDLDFSGLEGVPKGDAISDAIDQACNRACGLLEEYSQVELHCDGMSRTARIPVDRRRFASGPGCRGIRGRISRSKSRLQQTSKSFGRWNAAGWSMTTVSRWKRNCRFIPQRRW